MTEQDEKKRKLLQSRTAKVTIDRLNQMSMIDGCTVGEIIDQLVEVRYNSYVAEGKVRDYLIRLQSIDSNTK